MPNKPKSRSHASANGLVLGLEAAAKINTVEGIELSPEMRRLFRSFEQEGLPPRSVAVV